MCGRRYQSAGILSNDTGFNDDTFTGQQRRSDYARIQRIAIVQRCIINQEGVGNSITIILSQIASQGGTL